MARLSYAARQRLKKHMFALPGNVKKGPRGARQTEGAYPIDTIDRGRNALARAAQALKAGNLTQAQHDEIVRKVHARYPSIGKRKAAVRKVAKRRKGK